MKYLREITPLFQEKTRKERLLKIVFTYNFKTLQKGCNLYTVTLTIRIKYTILSNLKKEFDFKYILFLLTKFRLSHNQLKLIIRLKRNHPISCEKFYIITNYITF